MPQVPFINLEYFFQKTYDLITGLDLALLIQRIFGSVENFLTAIWLVSMGISLLLVAGIVYSLFRLKQIGDEERAEWKKKFEEATKTEETGDKRWEMIQSHINSPNQNDWKMAIINADTILDEMLQKMGYIGETLGDRLKKVEKSDFNTIDKAWEAHRMRNSISHEGMEFALTEREARRVIDLYREVFEEFHLIPKG